MTNAIEAVLHGGKIGVKVELAGSDFALATVEDNGCGIAENIKSQVFVPFFTTKLTRKNTGLGLPICRHIVEEAGGTMDFTSLPGTGTSFRIRLPLARN